MSKQADQLIVRRHSRVECDVAARVRMDEGDDSQVVFSRSVMHADGSVAVRIVDCSAGGLGIQSSVYLPKGSHLVVTVAGGSLAGLAQDVVLHVRVQRGSMVDRSPLYYMGTSLVDRGITMQVIDSLLKAARAQNRQDKDKGVVGEGAQA